jgi:cytochrome c oxidase subunit 2
MMQKLLGLPVLASEHGKDVDNFIIYIHWLMIALFVGWLAFFIYTLVRFRQSRNPKADHVGVRGHASTWLEGAVALIEAVLLLGFAIPLWAKVVDQFPSDQESTTVRIVAQQFGWNVIYPGKDGEFGRQDMSLVTNDNPFGFDKSDPKTADNFVSLNELRVPADKHVLIHLSSQDVIHSFKVIALRVCQDAIPGMVIPTHFKPTKIGSYQINCAQLCGNGHYSMSSGKVVVQTPGDYATWLTERSKTPAAAGFE